MIARIAARQHGVVTTAQLAAAGIPQQRLDPADPIGANASSPSRRLRRRALWTGQRRKVDGSGPGQPAPAQRSATRAAAALWNLLPSTPGAIDVTIPHRISRANRCGIRLHRSLSLTLEARDDRGRNIPVTTPARTIFDLRRVVSPAQLRRAIREAEVLGLETGLEERIRANSQRAGASLPAALPASPPADAGGERRDRAFRRRLPLARSHSLIVETDGYQFHRGRQAFEDDRGPRLRSCGSRAMRCCGSPTAGHSRRMRGRHFDARALAQTFAWVRFLGHSGGK